jgi:hypothetical protein
MDEPWRNPDGSVNYYEYINAQEWRRRRRAYLRKYALCNRCSMDNDEHKAVYGTALHVHHASYARLGAELDEDLEALCKRCHDEEECAEYDPTAVGDHLAIELGVGERHGRLPIPARGYSDGDISGPPEVYWAGALARLEARRRQIANGHDTEEARRELDRLDGLETLAKWCLERACPEYASEIVNDLQQEFAEREERWSSFFKRSE